MFAGAFKHSVVFFSFTVFLTHHICSREFTHRVKSVSMAKFTSQEVNALQQGGNQVFLCLRTVFTFLPYFEYFSFSHRVDLFPILSVQRKSTLRNGILTVLSLTAGLL